MKSKMIATFLLITFILSQLTINALAFEVEIFSTDTDTSLAENISNLLGKELADVDIKTFSDGEISVKLKKDVTSKECIIISSVCKPVNENLMKLLITIDAMKRNFSGSVIAVIPYLGYARQDRKPNYGEPISAKLVANLIKTAGADKVVTMDLHAMQEEGFFNIPVMNLKGLDIFAEYFKNKLMNNADELVVVAPDMGSSKRAREFASKLGCKSAIIDKYRPKPNESQVVGIYGDVKGKKAILIDDMVDTGGTICNAAKSLIEEGGAKEVYACATHAVLSGDALDKIEKSPIRNFVFLDTIPKKLNGSSKLVFMSSAEKIADAIKKIVN